MYFSFYGLGYLSLNIVDTYYYPQNITVFLEVAVLFVIRQYF